MSKKEFKPSYIVNVDNIETLADIPYEFAISKHNAGIALTDEELSDIIEYVVNNISPNICVLVDTIKTEVEEKKLPWYKRLWYWLTGKKR